MKIIIMLVTVCVITISLGQHSVEASQFINVLEPGKFTFQTTGGVNRLEPNVDIMIGNWDKQVFLTTGTVNYLNTGDLFTWDVNSPGFSDFVSLLNNGVDEWIQVIHWPVPGGVFGYESEIFSGSNWPGFDNVQINNVELFITRLQLDIPGDDPNGDGIWTDYNYAGTVTINYTVNSVPIPSALWLFSSGLLGMIGIATKLKPADRF